MASTPAAVHIRNAATVLEEFVQTALDTLATTDTHFVSLPPVGNWADHGLRQVAYGVKSMLWPAIVEVDRALRCLGMRLNGQTLEPERFGVWASATAHRIDFSPQFESVGRRLLTIGTAICVRHDLAIRSTVDESGRLNVEIPREYEPWAVRTADQLRQLADALTPLRSQGHATAGPRIPVSVRAGGPDQRSHLRSFSQEELDQAIRAYKARNADLYVQVLEMARHVGVNSTKAAQQAFGRNAIAAQLRCRSPAMVGKSPAWLAIAKELNLPHGPNRVTRSTLAKESDRTVQPSTVLEEAAERQLRERLRTMGGRGQSLLEQLDNGSQTVEAVEEILRVLDSRD